MNFKHMFVVCAYQESPYLEECLISLKKQTVPTEIIVCTSTPNEYIERMARKYHIELVLNDRGGNIRIDWNFAYGIAQTDYVTLVHQDDVYDKDYTKYLFEAIRQYDDMLIFFTNYTPIKMKGSKKKSLMM